MLEEITHANYDIELAGYPTSTAPSPNISLFCGFLSASIGDARMLSLK